MIRKMVPADLDRLMEIWLCSNLDAHPFIPPEFWQNRIYEVRRALPTAEVFVYETDGKIAAFAGVIDGFIAGIFTDRAFRSRGIGQELIAHCKSRWPALTLCVYQKNGRALSFYRREGFQTCRTQTDEATGEAEQVMVWEQDRPQAPPLPLG